MSEAWKLKHSIDELDISVEIHVTEDANITKQLTKITASNKKGKGEEEGGDSKDKKLIPWKKKTALECLQIHCSIIIIYFIVQVVHFAR